MTFSLNTVKGKHKVDTILAEKIVAILHSVTSNDIQFMGEGGQIIATTQPHRLGTIHQGAKSVMSGAIDEAAISAEDALSMKGVQPGYTGPIELNGERIACIGVTGDPTLVKPLQKMAAIVVTEEIVKDIALRKKHEIIKEIFNQITEVTATIEELTSSAQEVAASSNMLEATADEAIKLVHETNKILDVIKSIANQTNMLGLNAAIEAARAGAQGKGFSVVAGEVRKLSTSSRQSVENVSKTLADANNAVDNVKNSITDISVVSNQQASALESLSQIMQKIQELVYKVDEN